jgi:hypothetical protein
MEAGTPVAPRLTRTSPPLLAGFWMLQVKSKAEALEWAARIPFTDGEVVEVRQVFEASDFSPEVFPPEEAAREEALRAEPAKKAGKP